MIEILMLKVRAIRSTESGTAKYWQLLHFFYVGIYRALVSKTWNILADKSVIIEAAQHYSLQGSLLGALSQLQFSQNKSYVRRHSLKAMDFALDLELNLAFGVLRRIFWNLVPLW
jgi:hypothetical protein